MATSPALEQVSLHQTLIKAVGMMLAPGIVRPSAGFGLQPKWQAHRAVQAAARVQQLTSGHAAVDITLDGHVDKSHIAHVLDLSSIGTRQVVSCNDTGWL